MESGDIPVPTAAEEEERGREGMPPEDEPKAKRSKGTMKVTRGKEEGGVKKRRAEEKVCVLLLV